MSRKISKYFGLPYDQAQLDFVDVFVSTDLPLFIDPYFVSTRDDLWFMECHEAIVSFFEAIIACIRRGDHVRGSALLDKLTEPNETRLGLSSGRPRGRGVSGTQAQRLYQKLIRSRAAKTGLLSELSDFDLFVDGVRDDKVSDMSTNIIRRQLIQYTQDQCVLHKIPMQRVPSGRLWDPANVRWAEDYVQLPVAANKKLLLVPKACARWSLQFSPEEYYNRFVLEFLREEHLRTNSSLVEILRNGTRRITKKSLKREFPFSKEALATFTEAHPEVLTRYKESLLLPVEISNQELVEGFDESVFAASLRDELATIPPGAENATKYHRFIAGVLEFIFYPKPLFPVLEDEINEGRKRIDIRYTNSAREGFFYRRRTDLGSRAINVYVECKNYSHEVGNPELDQLAGRFSLNRGRFGFLLARKFESRDVFLMRCKDTANAGNGFIIPLVDADVREMLTFIADGNREQIEGFLERRFQELIR